MTDAYDYPVIMRVLVGSRAHGLADEHSDADYREVFYVPTRELLSLPVSSRPKMAWESINKHTDDEGGHEVGHFLDLACRSVPSVIECLAAPLQSETGDGREIDMNVSAELQALLPYVLSTDSVRKAVLGYANNARMKIFNQGESDARAHKWAVTYLRSLIVGYELLATGKLRVSFLKHYQWRHLRSARDGTLSVGKTIELGLNFEQLIREAKSVLPERPDYDRVNAWLMRFRQEHFDA